MPDSVIRIVVDNTQSAAAVQQITRDLNSLGQAGTQAGVALDTGLRRGTSRIPQVTRDINAGGSALQNFARTAATVGAGFGTAFQRVGASVTAVSNAVFNLRTAFLGLGVATVARSIVQTAQSFEAVQRSLTAVTSSSADAAREFAFVQQEADRLGLNLASTAREYTNLTAASRGTALEGAATRDIFSAIAEAAGTLGLRSDQLGGALLAVQQVISKGTVSAEELRGQLGERLPGAFQIAARALGVTTAELDKFLRSGQITAEQLLPAFADELRRTFGTDTESRIRGFTAEFNRFQTAIQLAANEIARSGFIDELTKGIQEFRREISGPEFQQFFRDVGAFAGQTIALLARNLDVVIKGFGALLALGVLKFFVDVTTAVITLARTLLNLLIPAVVAAGKAFIAAFGPALVAAINLVTASVLRLNAALLASPIVRVGAAILALKDKVDEFRASLSGASEETEKLADVEDLFRARTVAAGSAVEGTSRAVAGASVELDEAERNARRLAAGLETIGTASTTAEDRLARFADVLRKAPTAAEARFDKASESLSRLASTISSSLTASEARALEAAENIELAIGDISTVAGRVFNDIGTDATQLFTNIERLVTGLGGTFGATFAGLSETIRTQLGLSESAFSGTLSLLGRGLETFGLTLEEVFGQKAAAAIQLFGSLTKNEIDAIVAAGSKLLDFFNFLFPSATTTATSAHATHSAAVTAATVATTATSTSLWTTFVTTASGLWTSLTTNISALYTGFLALFTGGTASSTGIWATFTTFMSTTWATVTGFLSTLYTGFVGLFATGTASSTITWASFTAFLQANWLATTGVLGALYLAFGGQFSSITGGMGSIFQAFTGLLGATFSSATSLMSGLFSGFGSLFGSITGNMGGVFSGFAGGMASAFSAAVSAMSSAFSSFGSFFQGIVSGLASSFSGFISSAIGGLNSLVGAASSAAGGITSSIGGAVSGAIGAARSAASTIGGILGLQSGGVIAPGGIIGQPGVTPSTQGVTNRITGTAFGSSTPGAGIGAAIGAFTSRAVFSPLSGSIAFAAGGLVGGPVGGFLASAVFTGLQAAIGRIGGTVGASIGARNSGGGSFSDPSSFGGRDRTSQPSGTGGIGSFAKGGVVDAFQFGGTILQQPNFFRVLDSANKPTIGVAGEAGPEAILPLRRLSGGELGVLAKVPREARRSEARQMKVFIDARGADRQGLQELRNYIEHIDGSLEYRSARVLEELLS